jgi:Ig-like domain from next to BRCA1 gene
MQRTMFRSHQQYAIRFLYCVLLFLLAACSPQAAPTYFIAPHGPSITPSETIALPSATPTLATTPTLIPSPAASLTPSPSLTPASSPTLFLPTITSTSNFSPTPRTCTDSIKFLADLTYPDDTVVAPGQTLQKQWSVQNDGTCDWDENYRVKLVQGYPALGAPAEMALFPARAGTKADITINFTAPQDAGTYRTVWQAANPDGIPFGAPIYMEIVVQPK